MDTGRTREERHWHRAVRSTVLQARRRPVTEDGVIRCFYVNRYPKYRWEKKEMMCVFSPLYIRYAVIRRGGIRTERSYVAYQKEEEEKRFQSPHRYDIQ